MSCRKLLTSVMPTVATAFVLALGSAGAATISELDTTPKVTLSVTNLLGRPVLVAVDQSGHLYVMTFRGWIYSLSGTLATVAQARLPGPLGGARPQALALAVTTTGDIYAGRADNIIYHYNTALALQGQSAAIKSPLVGVTADSTGNVYAASGGGQITKLTSSLGSPTTGSVTLTGSATVVAIRADTTGNIFVAASDGTVFRLNNSLATQANGSVPGTPVGIATDSAGDVIVASTNGLFAISSIGSNISIISQNGSLTNLIGVDLDSAGDVVAADSTGAVSVMNTGLSSPRTVSTGLTPTRSIAINVASQSFIVGGPDGASEGDVHLTTIDGVRYDFQSAGEFVLFRHGRSSEAALQHTSAEAADSGHEAVEIQVRQYPVATTGSTCVSLNAAVAARIGKHRLTYEPNLSGQPDPSGLQLRIDRKLVSLHPSGMALGSGGRVVPTSTPGGLEVDFPDDTVLFVTPGWWSSQSKWYLNVNVVPGQHAAGLVGSVPQGSWLPALPDGSSMGPAPAAAHQRYVELYGRFADAWRVTEKSSLFDYAPGTSTNTFTMRSWPPELGVCAIPGAVPIEGATEAVAQAACKGVPGDPANCIFDVEVAGLANIGRTYVASRNSQPVWATTHREHEEGAHRERAHEEQREH